MTIDEKEWIADHAIFIEVAAACHRIENPSYSWHVLDWMSYKLRLKYPLVMRDARFFTYTEVT